MRNLLYLRAVLVLKVVDVLSTLDGCKDLVVHLGLKRGGLVEHSTGLGGEGVRSLGSGLPRKEEISSLLIILLGGQLGDQLR